MKRVLISASALALGAAAAHAGGVEWSNQSVGILFDKGNQVQFSLGYVDPTVSGHLYNTPSVPSGDMSKSYMPYTLGFRMALNPNADLAFVIDQPIGAKIAYPANTNYPLRGSTGDISSTAYTLMTRYRFQSNVSVYGGLRLESTQGSVSLPAYTYSMSTNTSTEPGYLVGVAYEKPEIALRVALTYNSEIKHTFGAAETAGGNTYPSTFETTTPKSWNLEFQTGVAPKTLVFGSIKWRDWTAFKIAPPIYVNNVNPAKTPLVDYSNDVVTYNLGIGRKFNDTWSGAVTLGYEKSDGTPVGNLSPTDGKTSIGVGVTYTKDKVKITGGVAYVKLGNATTSGNIGQFQDNHAIAMGIKVGYSF